MRKKKETKQGGRTIVRGGPVPLEVRLKIVQAVKDLGLSRFHFKYANGPLPHEKLMTSIELFGTKVAPRVREMLG